MRDCYLAIDIGASSGRHIVGWEEDGEIVTREVYRFPNGAVMTDEGLIWQVDRLFAEVVNGLKAAKEQGFTPRSVGIDTWAVDYALLDRNDVRIGDVFSYRDKRTERAAREVHAIMPFEELYGLTGIQYQPFNTIYQLYADVTSGRIDNAATMLMLPDYLGFLLTGVKRQEYTNATSTGMVNAKTHTWDREILSALGYNASLFGTLSDPGVDVGVIKPELAREIGYTTEVVLPPTHDTAAAVEGIPFEEPAPYISSGTWSLLGYKVKRAHTDDVSRAGNWSNEGGPGYFRYQKNIMGMWVVNRLHDELCPDKEFDKIVAEAERRDYNETVNVNGAEFLAPDSMKAAFDAGLSHTKMPRCDAEYFRCAYVSLAHSYAQSLEELKRNTRARFDTLYVVGGGAKNRFLNRLTEWACNIRVKALPIEASALGNLKIQIARGKQQ